MTDRTLRWNWRWLLLGLGIAVVVVLFVAAACGGEEGEEGDQGTPIATRSPGAAGSPAVGTPAAADIKELKELSAKWAQSSGKVTYKFATKESGQTIEGDMVIYWRPPDWRADISSQGEKVIMIAAGNTTYFCLEEERQCISMPMDPSEAIDLPFLSDFTDADAIDEAIGQLSGSDIKLDATHEKVAGKDAHCFTATGKLDGGEGTAKWCFADDGLLLLISSTEPSGVEFTLRATEVGKTSDSDFKPPYPTTTLPNLLPSPTR